MNKLLLSTPFLPIVPGAALTKFELSANKNITDIRLHCQTLRMNLRGCIFTAIGPMIVISLMFYSGMFMHRDPVE